MSSADWPTSGPPTMPQRFLATVKNRGDAVALRAKQGEDAWLELTWNEVAEQVARVAGGLQAMGIRRGDRVVLLMRNRPEFHIIDHAITMTGATPISIYNSSAPDQIAYLVGHCGATVAIVEDQKFLDRFLAVRNQLPNLAELFLIETDGELADGIRPFSELLTAEPVDLDAAAQIAQPDDLVTVIYTSGTTGPPKGVQITHHNVCWTIDAVKTAFKLDPTGMRIMSYLPMAHIAERMVSHYQGTSFGNVVTTCPETSEILPYLAAVRPQIFFAVPRVYEKAQATITALVNGDPEKAAAFQDALAVGIEADEYRRRGEDVPAELAQRYAQADAEQLGLWRNILGLDEVVSAASGAAPLAPETFAFFRGLGVPLSEIYGLSETTGPLTWEPFAVRAATVGPALPGCVVELAEDGEIIAKGGNIFGGYLDAPEKTAEVVDADGWFHTGDIGKIDDDGYVSIVDRKKELIITAGGKNISPANLESALKGSSPLIGQACVIGDAKPYLSALIVLDAEVAPVWAATHGITDTSNAALADDPQVQAEVQRAVDEVNAHVSQVENIRRFTILANEWLPDSVELTPTMKLKRRGIHEKYATEIETLYEKR